MLIGLGVVALAAMIFLVPRGGIGFGVGLGLVLLLCPLVMGTMMWLMMRRPDAATEHPGQLQSQPTDDHPSASGAHR